MAFVLLKTFSNYIEANIALAMLEEQNIICHIEDENTITIINLASGMRLMVHESQVGRAKEILLAAEEEFLKNLTCPICNQHGFEIKIVTENHEEELRKLWFGAFINFMSKLLSSDRAIVEVKHYVCLHCNHEFNAVPA